ncbi:MAG TPA: hypothetical protein EYP92_04555 [Candidatus Thioglobus sp.]|jgi:uncharacterized protein|nr:hypothetical protein [Candidatus Thioglobus sp.]
MSVILVTVGLVFGAYLYQPLWFDNGPYHYVSSHEALADCQKAKSGNEYAVCANGELYLKDDSVVKIEQNDFVFTIDKQDSTDTTMKSHWNE